MKIIPFSSPDINEQDIDSVAEVIRVVGLRMVIIQKH